MASRVPIVLPYSSSPLCCPVIRRNINCSSIAPCTHHMPGPTDYQQPVAPCYLRSLLQSQAGQSGVGKQVQLDQEPSLEYARCWNSPPPLPSDPRRPAGRPVDWSAVPEMALSLARRARSEAAAAARASSAWLVSVPHTHLSSPCSFAGIACFPTIACTPRSLSIPLESLTCRHCRRRRRLAASLCFCLRHTNRAARTPFDAACDGKQAQRRRRCRASVCVLPDSGKRIHRSIDSSLAPPLLISTSDFYSSQSSSIA